ncbi:MAG: hypothetical protein R6U52_07605 [Kosmotogaceae bacterium]
MKKVAVLAFQGEKNCFYHALLNSLDMKERGMDVSFIIEGQATKLISELVKPDYSLHNLYKQIRDQNLISAVCFGCSKMMGTLDIAKDERLPISGEMSGHVPIGEYVLAGYEIVTF